MPHLTKKGNTVIIDNVGRVVAHLSPGGYDSSGTSSHICRVIVVCLILALMVTHHPVGHLSSS